MNRQTDKADGQPIRPDGLQRLGFAFSTGLFRLSRLVRDAWYRIVRAPLDRLRWQLWNRTGLPGDRSLTRRCVIARLPDCTAIEIPPRTLQRYISHGQHGANKKRFFWNGEWDRKATPIEEQWRYRMLADIWRHRDDLSASDTYRDYCARIEDGRPRKVVNKGLLLDTPHRIVDYLEEQLRLFRSMQAEGFRPERAPDELNIAIGRDGAPIKAKSGRKRTMVAIILGLESIPVRISHVHVDWWLAQRERFPGTRGEQLRAALTAWREGMGFSPGVGRDS